MSHQFCLYPHLGLAAVVLLTPAVTIDTSVTIDLHLILFYGAFTPYLFGLDKTDPGVFAQLSWAYTVRFESGSDPMFEPDN